MELSTINDPDQSLTGAASVVVIGVSFLPKETLTGLS